MFCVDAVQQGVCFECALVSMMPLHPLSMSDAPAPIASLAGLVSDRQRRLLQAVCLWVAMWGVLSSALASGGLHAWVPLAALPASFLAWYLEHRNHPRAAAALLLASMLTLVSILAWWGTLHHTSTILLLAVMVVFGAWGLGVAVGAAAATWAIVLGVCLTQRGDLAWQQVLLGGYVLASLLALIAWMLGSKNKQMQSLRSALAAVGAQKQQLHVLFQAIEQSPQSMAIVDIHGRLVYANQAFEQRTGYTQAEVVGKLSRQVSLTGLSVEEHAYMRHQVQEGKVWQGVVHNTLKDGSVVADAVRIAPILDENMHLTHLVEVRQDISEQLAAQDRIRHLQEHDSLTALLNTQGVLRAIERMNAETPMHQSPATWHMLLLVEVDRYQSVVSVRESEWVTVLLQAMVQRLQALAPQNTHLGRTAEGQFALVVPHIGNTRHEARTKGSALAQFIHEGLGQILLQAPGGGVEPVRMTHSLGFTVFPFVEEGVHMDTSSRVLRRATVALSQARHQGGDQVSAYSAVLDATVQRRILLEAALVGALQTEQLQVYLQPQVDMYGRVVGLESLVRWQHPQLGMIPPSEIIFVAENSGLIAALGDWMLSRVCDLLQDPRVRDANYSLSVNVSAVQFQRDDFVDRVQSLVQCLGARTDRLVLEVTESLLLYDVDQAIEKMNRLRALGLELSLDDFGTGYSSLAYLARLPIQEIKLDRMFIRDLTPGSQAGVLVEAVLMVAKVKGLRVVAEGVEEQIQAQLLQALEPSILCQGYWFSRPVPAQEWLAHPQLLHTE